ARKISPAECLVSAAVSGATAMTPTPSSEVTQLLEAAQSGDAQAKEQFFRLVYEQLRAGAEARLRSDRLGAAWRLSDFLQEVMVRLVTGDVLGKAPNPGYLFGAASRAMRHVLVDFSRKARPPGGQLRPLEEAAYLWRPGNGIDLLALHEALE